jgi:hypothetical protein
MATRSTQTTKARTGTPNAAAASAVRGGASREKIAERAYAIWQSSGRPDGRDQEHWLQAERELSGGKQ